MSEDFMNFVSAYFLVNRKLINKRTRLDTLERTVHDRILFTFELESHYRIEFEDEELLRLRSLGDYLALLEQKLRFNSQENDFACKRAA